MTEPQPSEIAKEAATEMFPVDGQLTVIPSREEVASFIDEAIAQDREKRCGGCEIVKGMQDRCGRLEKSLDACMEQALADTEPTGTTKE